ncbi:MAG: hypothetical protein JNL21_01290 [Myxococcales bacterium]|nr:hypothetical protein [Myxococcales bacterium]
MATFATRIPENADQLHEHLTKLFEGRTHIRSVNVNPTTRAIEVDLDWTANNIGGVEDFALPLKADKMAEAGQHVATLRREFDAGHAPERDIAQRLFQCIRTRGSN